MVFIIKKSRKSPKYRDCFVFKIKVMYGDADGYGEVIVSGFKKDCSESKVLMENLVNTLIRMENAYPHGRGGYDTYDHDEGFIEWFGDEIFDGYDELSEFHKSLLDTSWPYDPDGYGIQSSYDSYKLSYYDNEGNEFDVKVVN